MSSPPIVSAQDARILLLEGQGLLEDPARRAGPQAVAKIATRLGFVQVDSIQRIERAHHLILGARLDDYRAAHLDHATFRLRALFEHWTHDASLIPTEWFHHWKP
ncbi:MAG TPA: crosslink repair DNA glycosylase YcaQ family protein, partial [Steroidobacteraceae bacterium]|nr:crosslink repair DNA glycosylase YcaQ family protein [Steroidobacteraceae bacterium]